MERHRKTLTAAIRAHKTEILAVILILLVAAFLRLYKIREFVIFLGDEGRDALVVKRMIVDHKFTLLGPTASVGGFYLGPVFYYFMIPFLWLFAFDPVGPAVMVALIGIATVGLLYWVVRSWANPIAAGIAAALYATAPGVVSASRSSWNPNIMPFFALLSVFALSKALSKNRTIWYLIAGAAYGILIQSHYLGLVIGPVLAVATLITLPVKRWLKAALLEFSGFIIGASMFLAFEVRHNFPNTRTIIEFVSRGGDTTGPRSWNLFWLFYEMLRRNFESVLLPMGLLIKGLLLVSLVGFLLYAYRQRTEKKRLPIGLTTFLVWLVVGAFGIGAYKGQLYPHYFGFLFPLPFILMGITGAVMYQYKKGRKVAVLMIFALVVLNLSNQKIWVQGSNLVDQTKNVSQKIIEVADGKPFNFALIANGNSDHAYRYFLEITGQKPTPLEEEVTEQLVVVCENLDAPCEPLGHPLWEVAGFGRAEVVQEASVHPGIKIVGLRHHESSLELIGKPAPKGG
ncbi:glycosyltransferase family 39 protein [Patescibacteria group bacterium]|nr:glycosyltransferase family 39 protein [Patescibacteria group bacterium]